MRSGTLVPNVSEVKLVCLRARHGTIEIELRACRIFSYCPSCGVASRRIHSRYVRKVSDLLIDLLPDREADTVAAWLEHLGIEVVSRDRGGIYAEAARRAAPSATQVADRWHVLRNLSEALKKALDPHHRVLTQAARVDRADETPPVTQPQAPWNARELLVQQRN